MSMPRMTPYQRKAHKILCRHGWHYVRITSTSQTIYRKPGEAQQVVAATPKNPDQALKAVQRYAGIKRGNKNG